MADTNFIATKVQELIAAPSCCKEAREAGERWLKARGSAEAQAETEALIAELKADIMPIDGLIAFLQSEKGVSIFGAEGAAAALAHAKARKEAGERFCDCPACAACEIILREYGAL